MKDEMGRCEQMCVLSAQCAGRDRYTSINKTIDGTSERPGIPFKFRWHIFSFDLTQDFSDFTYDTHDSHLRAQTQRHTHSTHARCECQDGLKDAEAFHFICCVILSCVFSPPSPTSSTCTSFFFYQCCHRRHLRLRTGIYAICRFCLQIFFLYSNAWALTRSHCSYWSIFIGKRNSMSPSRDFD